MQMSCTSTSAVIWPARSSPTGCTIERSAMTSKIISSVTAACPARQTTVSTTAMRSARPLAMTNAPNGTTPSTADSGPQ